MKVEIFFLQHDDDGGKFLTIEEGLTKTKQGGLSVKNRLATPKMFATGHEERCFIMLFNYICRSVQKKWKGAARSTFQ